MTNLKTHDGRMEALTSALSATASAMEQAQIIHIASQMDRENSYLSASAINTTQVESPPGKLN